ncbi:PhnD/SsuA/transferrin family substrate-binding protein [Aliihoeflea aestuarii]|nr:PhnD/SsuA/transferrin family substrate-binding protein [Aliihoeflea aestuarii]
MYDWPEVHDETDALWSAIGGALRKAGIDAPQALTRETGNLHAFWRRPDILFAQTCWGPMRDGLEDHVHLVGQPDYSGVEGGEGEAYRSVILMREGEAAPLSVTVAERRDLLTGRRFAYNQPDSMSGYLALEADLGSLKAFSKKIPTGGHRASIRAVMDERADFCAIDCKSWDLAKRHEPGAADLVPIAWTQPRKGLPYIAGKRVGIDKAAEMRAALLDAGLIVA